MGRYLRWFVVGWLSLASSGWSDTFVTDSAGREAVIAGLSKVLELPASPEVVARLVAYSSMDDPWVAYRAVSRLGELGPAAADSIPALLAGLRRLMATGGPNRSAHVPPSPPYGLALSRIGPERWDVLVGLLEAGAAERRFTDNQDLRSWRERSDNGGALLRRAAMEPGLAVGQRRVALLALGSTHDWELVPSLPVLVREPDLRPAVYEYALRAQAAHANILPALLDFAVSQGGQDEGFVRRIFDRLANSGSTNNPSLIRKLLRHVFDPDHPLDGGWSPPEPQPVASLAMLAIIGISGHAVVEWVGPYCEDPDVGVRCGVAAACWSRVEEGRWVDRFRGRLNATNEVERTAFAATLVRVAGCRAEAELALVRSATSRSLTNSCRRLAILALSLSAGENGMTSAVREGLERCANDPDPLVQVKARQVLTLVRDSSIGTGEGIRSPPVGASR